MITQPDCAFAVGKLSQFIQNPRNVHWEALKWVMVNMGSTKDLWLTFGGHAWDLIEGFCDVDYAYQHDQHSIVGYTYLLGHGAGSWSLKKQQIVALLTVKAEYVALAHTAKEALWLLTFLTELQSEPECWITINSNNQGVIALSKDNKYHSWTKHINVWYHFICEAVEDEKLSVQYVPTDENPANIFMKLLAKVKFCQFAELLRLHTMWLNGCKKLQGCADSQNSRGSVGVFPTICT